MNHKQATIVYLLLIIVLVVSSIIAIRFAAKRMGEKTKIIKLEQPRVSKPQLSNAPTVYRDPIRPPTTSGPYASAYYNTGPLDGPQPYELQGVPVPAGTLKSTSDYHNYRFQQLNRPLVSSGYFKPYGFVSSVNAFLPGVQEVQTRWEKVGLLVQGEKLMNLYRRPIAPLQDLFEYAAQDRDGFMILLENERYLEDGDHVNGIPGKPGQWTVKNFVENKYVWV